MIEAGDLVLFQGDSITDCGRDRKVTQPNESWGLGRGYAELAAARMLANRSSDRLRFLNRGISGDTIVELTERWQRHCLDIKPNVLSLLIGVNDIWRVWKGESDRTAEDFEQGYRQLLDVTRSKLPDLKLVICEPFVLRCGTVDDRWFPDFDIRRAMVRDIAKDYQAVFVPLQTMFDQAAVEEPASYWARDGVHPTLPGHMRMADCWLQAVGEGITQAANAVTDQ